MHKYSTINKARSLFIVAALGLAGAACGGDDDDDATESDVESTADTEAPDETESTPAPTEAPSTTAEATGSGVQPLDEPVTLRVGLQNPNFTVHGSVLAAEELGVLDEWGIDMQIENVRSADGRPLLAQGDLDLQVGTIGAEFFNAINQDLELACIAKTQSPSPEDVDRSGWWARGDLFADPQNPTGDELIGARVGSAGGPVSSTIHYFNELLKERFDISVSDVELQQMGSPEMPIALENEALDVGFLIAPYWQEAEAAGELVYLGRPSNNDSAICIVAGPRLLDEEPELAAVFIAALNDTIDRYLQPGYLSDPAVVEALANATGQEASVIETFPEIPHANVPMPQEMNDGMQETFRELGVLDFEGIIPLSESFDPSALEAAAS